MGEEFITIVVTGVITSVLSSVTTVAALRVHIEYIKATLDRHELAIQRAHIRIDERRCQNVGPPARGEQRTPPIN